MRPVPLLLITCLFIASFAMSSDLRGSIEYMEDIKVMNLWGSWSEMGYAHGFLLGPDIYEVFHDYFLEMVGGSDNFENARLFFLAYFQVPEEFAEYTQGIISGISDTVSTYSPGLGRNIDYIDICVVSAIPDIAALKGNEMLLCSSVSAWNGATMDDPDLAGSPAVSRNLDYYVDSTGTVLDHSILITFDPEEGQDWISIGFPGFAGCLSGMNESGISASLNMGNNQGTSQYGDPFVPICMAGALGLAEDDFNGSGSCDVADMKDALTEWNRGNSYAIHVVADRELADADSSSAVVEVSNHNGYAFRYSTDEPDIAPGRMILTNHHRVLIPPVGCARYSMLLDSLNTNPDVTLARLWNFMGSVGWPPSQGMGGTIQTMVFMPEQLRTGISFSSLSTPSYAKDPQWVDWWEIFPNHTPEEIEEGVQAEQDYLLFPNPSSGEVSILVPDGSNSFRLFDTSGRKMDAGVSGNDDMLTFDLSGLPDGIYFIRGVSNGSIISEEIVLMR